MFAEWDKSTRSILLLLNFKFTHSVNQGCGIGGFWGVGVEFLTTLGVGVVFFCPTPIADVQLDHFLHHTPKLGIPVEMVQFLLKLLLKQTILAVHPDFHWFYKPNFIPFMLRSRSRKFWRRSESGVGNFGKSESEILERSESNILPPTPQPWIQPCSIVLGNFSWLTLTFMAKMVKRNCQMSDEKLS